MPELMHLRHKYKVLDFGVLTPYTLPEFKRCDQQIVLTNISCWKTKQLDQFLQNQKITIRKDRTECILFLCWGATKDNQKQIQRAYGIRVIPVPFLENPFQVSSKHFQFFEQIWKGD